MKSIDFVTVFVALGLAGLPSCAEKAPMSQSCPCAGANVCCASGVCAAKESACGLATLALAQESAGTWTGYLENFTLPSGSDALRVALSVTGDIVSADFVLGTAPPPPVPNDASPATPDGGVIPGLSNIWDGGFFDNRDYMVEGFVYHALNVRWESRRLKFTVPLGEAWQSTCDLYQPITVNGNTFICPDGWSYSQNEGCKLRDGTAIDCSKLAQCGPGGPCTCGETSCVPLGNEWMVDVALRGDIGDGSINGIAEGSTNIRLTRDSL